MSKKWTEEELEIIRNCKGKIPFVNGRTIRAIRHKMLELKVSQSKRNAPWTAEEIRLISEGTTHLEGRSRDAILDTQKKLKLTRSLKTTDNKPFSWKENESILRDLYDHGYDAQEIFEMKIFNTSFDSIKEKIKRLKLVEKEFVRLPESIKNGFKSFLSKNWENNTPKDLMELWNTTNNYQVNVNQVVYYLAILNIRIPYCEIQKINSIKEKEKELILFSKSNQNRLSEKIRFERIKIMRERAENHRDIWTGRSMPRKHEQLIIKEEDIWSI